MADIADIAADAIETNLQHTLDNLKRSNTPSLFECDECGEPIPEQRRRLGSVTLCFGCQTKLEAKQKLWRA